MPKKKVTAKKAPAKKKVSKVEVIPTNSRKNVNITKAENGYVVSSYGDKGEKTVIAKNKTEAKKAANKLLDL